MQYVLLTSFSLHQILLDPGIHSNLVTFVALLIANKCFLLHDVITYVLRPILRVHLAGQISSQNITHSLRFVISLTLHLLVDEYIEGHRASEFPHPVRLPPFVQHNLQAQCRQLDLVYIIVLLKDLLKISQINASRGGGPKGLLLVQQTSAPESESIHSQVMCLHQTLHEDDCFFVGTNVCRLATKRNRIVVANIRYVFSTTPVPYLRVNSKI